MSDYYLVVDENSVVKYKTTSEQQARDYALINTGAVYKIPTGTTVGVVVCAKCRNRIRNGVCPNNCEDR